MAKYKAFGERLARLRREKQFREDRDILKKDIAQAVGTSAGTYGRWEDGENMPDDPMMAKLARFFGVSPAFLHYGVSPSLSTGALGDTLDTAGTLEPAKKRPVKRAARG